MSTLETTASVATTSSRDVLGVYEGPTLITRIVLPYSSWTWSEIDAKHVKADVHQMGALKRFCQRFRHIEHVSLSARLEMLPDLGFTQVTAWCVWVPDTDEPPDTFEAVQANPGTQRVTLTDDDPVALVTCAFGEGFTKLLSTDLSFAGRPRFVMHIRITDRIPYAVDPKTRRASINKLLRLSFCFNPSFGNPTSLLFSA